MAACAVGVVCTFGCAVPSSFNSNPHPGPGPYPNPPRTLSLTLTLTPILTLTLSLDPNPDQVGGVIFAIEIVSTFYMLEHLPHAFFVVTWGLLFIRQVNTLDGDDPGNPFALFSTSHDHDTTFPPSMQLCFMLVGVLGAPLALLQARYLVITPELARALLHERCLPA